MPRAFLQRSRLRLLTVAAWSGLRPAPASRFRGAHPHLPRSCTTPVYLMLPPFCVSLQHTKAEKGEHQHLYQGISARPFRRIFNLADYVEVKGATVEGGLLKIELVREVPEAMKP